MAEPVRASDTPYAYDVEEGNTYFWCACGRSKSQPLCDGSHSGTGITPVMFEAKETTTVYFCGCKATKSQPLCDGSHNK